MLIFFWLNPSWSKIVPEPDESFTDISPTPDEIYSDVTGGSQTYQDVNANE